MEDGLPTLTLLGGMLAIMAFWVVIMYRVGNFTLMPGEPRGLLVTGGIGIAVVAAVILLSPVVFGLFGSAATLLYAGISVGLFVFFRLTRRRRDERILELVKKRPPEVQVEYARRTAFTRSPLGRRLFLAMVVTLLVWAFGLGLFTALLEGP